MGGWHPKYGEGFWDVLLEQDWSRPPLRRHRHGLRTQQPHRDDEPALRELDRSPRQRTAHGSRAGQAHAPLPHSGDEGRGLPSAGRQAATTTVGLTRGSNQPRHPHELRGDQTPPSATIFDRPAPPFSTAVNNGPPTRRNSFASIFAEAGGTLCWFGTHFLTPHLASGLIFGRQKDSPAKPKKCRKPRERSIPEALRGRVVGSTGFEPVTSTV